MVVVILAKLGKPLPKKMKCKFGHFQKILEAKSFSQMTWVIYSNFQPYGYFIYMYICVDVNLSSELMNIFTDWPNMYIYIYYDDRILIVESVQ